MCLCKTATYLQLKRRYIIISHQYLELKLLVYDWKKKKKTEDWKMLKKEDRLRTLFRR